MVFLEDDVLVINPNYAFPKEQVVSSVRVGLVGMNAFQNRVLVLVPSIVLDNFRGNVVVTDVILKANYFHVLQEHH